MKERFRRFAGRVSYLTGTATNFVFAICIVAIWAVSGPMFDFSNTWQLFINTFTTISTFLMVFVVQNTQNRESKAMQLKLDEIITHSGARDGFVDLEDMTDEELDELYQEFQSIHEKYYEDHSMRKLHKKIAQVHKQRLSKKSN